MIFAVLALLLGGTFLLFMGLSAYKDRNSTAMPLFFRGLHQKMSKEMGIAFLFGAAVCGVAAVGILISRLLA